MLSIYIVIYAITGLLSGLSAGLLGIGSGVIVVPVLYWIFFMHNFPYPMHMAIVTSLSVMVFTALSSTISQAVKKSVEWRLLSFLIVGVIIGGIIGPFIGKHASTNALKYSFGGLDVVIGILFLRHKKKSEPSSNIQITFLKASILLCIAVVVGIIATLLGTGGAFLIIPALVFLGFDAKKVAGTASAFTLAVSIIGTVSYYFLTKNATRPLGFIHLQALIPIAVVSLCFAPIGAHFSHKTNPKILKNIFLCFIFLAAVSMFI